MTRILTVTSWYPPHHFGGYELSCFDVMSRLVLRGHEVRVLCGDERLPGALEADPAHEALVFRELRPHRWEATTSRPSLRERVAIERHNRVVLERHLADFQPDVVSVWHMVAISMSLVRQLVQKRIPLVYVVCDNWLLYGERQDAWMSVFSDGLSRRMLGRLVAAGTGLFTSTGDLGGTGTFCFVSDHVRLRALEREPWSYPVSTVVYSGIDREVFPVLQIQECRKWHGRLLYVGRLDGLKGVDTLLRALTLLPDVTLACFGRGAVEERARLGRLAEELGVSTRVSFGSLERHELASHYRDADALIFPSEWDEPFGLVPLEAMACGTPVVATGVGGSDEFLRDGYNCVLFPPGDAGRLAAAVRRLASDPNLRDTLIRGGCRTAAQLDVDKLADSLESWHIATAERFRSGRPSDRALDLPGPVVQSPDLPRGADGSGVSVREHVSRRLCDRLPGRILNLDVGSDAGEERIRASVRARSASTNLMPVTLGHVVTELQRLPFRTGAFDGMCCVGALERAHDGVALVNELGRVVRRGGAALFVASIRLDASIARMKIRDRLIGLNRPQRAYLHSAANVREYSSGELSWLLDPMFRVRSWNVLGWDGGWKGRLASTVRRLPPFERFASAVAIDAERK